MGQISALTVWLLQSLVKITESWSVKVFWHLSFNHAFPFQIKQISYNGTRWTGNIVSVGSHNVSSSIISHYNTLESYAWCQRTNYYQNLSSGNQTRREKSSSSNKIVLIKLELRGHIKQSTKQHPRIPTWILIFSSKLGTL